MTEIFILFFLIILNGLFVMSEIALVSARKTKLEQLSNKGNINAKAALLLAENPDIFLSTAQIFITLISILTGLYSGEKFSSHLQPYLEQVNFLKPYASTLSTVFIVIIVTFLSIILGELLPKRIGLMKSEKIAIISAQPMKLLASVTFPIVWLLNKVTKGIFQVLNIKPGKDNVVTEEEIKAMINEGAEHGEIDEAEQQIIERVFHLGDRAITSLMTHRSDIIWLDYDGTIADLRDEIEPYPHSVYPVCEKEIDHIKGIVQLKDIVFAPETNPLKDYVKQPMFVPDNNTAYQVMEKFKQTKIHTAFIVDEYGTMQGMITLNDILEAIVGDIPEQGDDDYEIIERKDGTYLVDAQLPFYDFLAKFDKEEWRDDEQTYDTIAGFVIHHLERIPNPGDTFVWRDFSFEIIDMDGARIDKLLVTLSDDLKAEIAADI